MALANTGRGYLGNVQGATESEQRACSLAQEVLRSIPDDPEAQRILVMTDRHLARIGAWQGDARRAKGLLREAVVVLRRMDARRPAGGESSAGALLDELEILSLDGDWGAVRSAGPEAIQACERAIAQNSDPTLVPLLI